MWRKGLLVLLTAIASIFAVSVAVCQESPSGSTTSPAKQAPEAAKAGDGTQPPKEPSNDASDGTLLKTIAYTLIITLLISLIEVPVRSKASFRAALTAAFWLYATILALGNTASAILASAAVGVPWPELARPFFHAFFGVFAFQGIMSNTNLTFFDKGVLTIQDWIDKARSLAVDVAVRNQARRVNDESQALAKKLSETIPEERLNAHIAQHLGAETLAKIEADAAAAKADRRFYKALKFAIQKPDEASAVTRVS